MLKDFYSDDNKSDEQKIMKSAFQGNYVQSALNAQLGRDDGRATINALKRPDEVCG